MVFFNPKSRRKRIKIQIVRCRGSPECYKAVCPEIGLETKPISSSDVSGCAQSLAAQKMKQQIRELFGSNCHIVCSYISVVLLDCFHNERVDTRSSGLYWDKDDLYEGVDLVSITAARHMLRMSPDDSDRIYEAASLGNLFWLTEVRGEAALVRVVYG